MDEKLFSEHYAWADSIARSVRSRLPPSFPLDDLKQEARIAHWKCCEAYDASRGIPYRAYAYTTIYGAVLMTCRRKNYREATHEELNGHQHIDARPAPDEALVEDRERKLGDRRLNRQLAQVSKLIEMLAPADAFLVRRVYLEGAEVPQMAELWGVSEERMNRKVKAAVLRLKREARNA